MMAKRQGYMIKGVVSTGCHFELFGQRIRMILNWAKSTWLRGARFYCWCFSHPPKPDKSMVDGWIPFHLKRSVYKSNLQPMTSEETGKNLEVHLVAWQHLASFFENLGECLFKLRPKHHNVDHMAQDVPRTRLNPRKVQACFNDESFLGYVKRIGVRCHQSNMMERLYRRYLLYLSLRWRENAGWFGGAASWKNLGTERAWVHPINGSRWDLCALPTGGFPLVNQNFCLVGH